MSADYGLAFGLMTDLTKDLVNSEAYRRGELAVADELRVARWVSGTRLHAPLDDELAKSATRSSRAAAASSRLSSATHRRSPAASSSAARSASCWRGSRHGKATSDAASSGVEVHVPCLAGVREQEEGRTLLQRARP